MTRIERDQVVRPCDPNTPGTLLDAPPVEVVDEWALIKEARRRHRRRLASIAAAIVVIGVLITLAVVLLSSTPNVPAGKAANRAPRSHSVVLTPARCSPNQLAATVLFNASHTDLGAIKLSNTSAKACSLSGRPQVDVLNVTGSNGTDSVLNTVELPFARAGLPPPQQNASVQLSAGGSFPQGIVELDWYWCGAPPGPVSFEVWFPKWSLPLTVPVQAVSPAGFLPAVPSGCPSTAVFAVDVIRGLGPNGVIVPTS
jgi:hypothetical protein